MGKKGKKGKKGSAKGKKADKAPEVDPNADLMEMTPEELQGQVMRLRDTLDREREQRNHFQLERDKVFTFWEITKRQLEETKAELRNKDREIEEAEGRHAFLIKVYKQKVKHILLENKTSLTDVKTDSAMSKKLTLEEHQAEQGALRRDKRGLKVELKEQELAHEDIVRNLQLEYDKRVTQLRDDLTRQAKELEAKYERKMDLLRDDLELQRKAEIHEIEERKNGQINTLMLNHDKAFGDIKNYYNDITLNNLALINSLKEQVETLKKAEERNAKVMATTMAENKKLAEPLAAARSQLADMRKQMSGYETDKEALARAKARLKLADEAAKQHEWEHEVLQQRFGAVESERDELYDKFVKTIYDVQQKSGFKNLLLEKKLSALGDQLEKKEAQLNEVLSASNLDPTALSTVTKKLEDVLDAKNSTIKDLKYELARVSKAFRDTVQAYDEKLGEHGIAIENLGFTVQGPDLSRTLGKGPAGLVAAPN